MLYYNLSTHNYIHRKYINCIKVKDETEVVTEKMIANGLANNILENINRIIRINRVYGYNAIELLIENNAFVNIQIDNLTCKIINRILSKIRSKFVMICNGIYVNINYPKIKSFQIDTFNDIHVISKSGEKYFISCCYYDYLYKLKKKYNVGIDISDLAKLYWNSMNCYKKYCIYYSRDLLKYTIYNSLTDEEKLAIELYKGDIGDSLYISEPIYFNITEKGVKNE